MYEKPEKFKREVARELKGRTSKFKNHTASDSTTKGLHGGSPFTKSTLKAGMSHLPNKVRSLPKNDDSEKGQLNNDTRSDRNVPEKMPRLSIDQGRTNEAIKYGKTDQGGGRGVDMSK